jgi:mannose-1-phosphate guanylyltransferase
VSKKTNFYPVILAGGRGTRFWPLSRRKCAKQMLALDGDRTMIQQTVERLLPLADSKRVWIITNSDLREGIAQQLPKLPKKQIVAEPMGRNTAPAIGLAAFILMREDPDAVIGMFPSDHVISKEKDFQKVIKKAADIAAAGENMVVMGIQPYRNETGYGYIEAGGVPHPSRSEGWDAGPALNAKRFTEKPDEATAEKFVAAGNYYWNSGMFVWGARTLANALREHLPKTAPLLEEIADAYGTRKFETVFKKLYPKCENISVDYAVLEPRSAKGEGNSKLYCIPSDFGWNDLGSWAALYDHRSAKQRDNDNVIHGRDSFVLNASGNYVHSPKKFIATVGVSNLVIVETDDALLITTREKSQDVGKVVKYLDEKKLVKLT